MAGGKASARQKMINLMYLVFIAMMAMNMSKEVLSAFGLMEAKFAESNEATTATNLALLTDLTSKAEEKPEEFAIAASKAKQVNIISDRFYKYIETLKVDLLKSGKYSIDPDTGKLPFEAMDKTDILDEKWFTGDRLTKDGEKVMTEIKKYITDIKAVIGDDVMYKKAIDSFEKRFNTEQVANKDGVKIEWLAYNYQGFPAIASFTKLTALQNDVKVTEASLFNLFLGNTLTEAVTLKNYQAIVLADKSAFFAGEKFQGRVVLGKYANVTPTKLTVQGQEINLTNAIDETGAAKLDFNVGNVGEHPIEGKFTFLEDGKPLDIPIIGNYVVVPRPNDASIAADKMNVVYRGLDNPLTISIAGISSDKVSVTGPGISKVSNGKYVVVPPSDGKNTINITATGTLQGGDQIISTKKFRVKNIPKTLGRISGQTGSVSLNKRDLSVSRVEAYFSDFAYDLPVNVVSFDVTISGQPTITVRGNRLSQDAKDAISRARRRSTVTIDRIQVEVPGVAVTLSKATPLIIKLTN